MGDPDVVAAGAAGILGDFGLGLVADGDAEVRRRGAGEAAEVGRQGVVGDELRTVAPERYSELYNWASTSLANELWW